MKYVVLVADGMADYPLEELDGRTPLQVARKPNLDRLAQKSLVGRIRTIPRGMPTGSDVANLSLLGYDPKRYYPGRGPLEATSLGVSLGTKDVAFRCNLVTVDKGILIDYSAGHITSREAKVLVNALNEHLGNERIQFYPGVSYRQTMVWRGGPERVRCIPPHDIMGQPISKNLPRGEGAELLKFLLYSSLKYLDEHEVNQVRRDIGENPGNMIWLWGQGKAPELTTFKEKYGLEGAVISAVDLVKGIGICAGLEPIKVPGITGYLDTNYLGKAKYALRALKGCDFVYIHVEAPDEASHEGNIRAKIKAIEDFDNLVVGTIREGIEEFGTYKILILPDHYTSIVKRTHTRDEVPFLIYSNVDEANGVDSFDELSVSRGHLHFRKGYKLMDLFIKGSP